MSWQGEGEPRLVREDEYPDSPGLGWWLLALVLIALATWAYEPAPGTTVVQPTVVGFQ